MTPASSTGALNEPGPAEVEPVQPKGPLVSIVTPTFNSRRFLRETMASIAGQTYPNIEHIVIDGGSTDGTLDVIRACRGVIWTSGRDSGMYDAINKGLRMAKGSILAYLNADDLYVPDSVERVVRFFDGEPGADFVFSDCRYIDENGTTLFTRKYPSFRWTMYTVLDGSTVPQQTCFWRRRVHDTVGYFDAGYRMAGDFEFIVRAGKSCAIRKLKGAPLALFRFHPGMLTLNRQGLGVEEIRRIHEQHPVSPPWAVPLLKAVATARYRLVNYHRLADKLRLRLSGTTPAYRP